MDPKATVTVDFSAKLINELADEPAPLMFTETKPMTLGIAAAEALVGIEKPPKLTKWQAWQLAEKVCKAEQLEVEPEELIAIKAAIEEKWPTIVVGPAFKALGVK